MNALFQFFTNPPETGVAQIVGHTMKPSDGFLALIGYVCALLTALILHEYAHGYVAFKCGDDTAKLSGRLSLNPKITSISSERYVCFCSESAGLNPSR